jgi:basic amino acid/polyamine antiporter, APA family
MGKPGALIIAIGAIISVTGTLNAIMLVGSRLPFAFSQEKQFPALFSFIHPKYKTPTWSLLLFMGITIAVSLSYSFISAASLSAITRVMIYAIVCSTLMILRRKRPEQSGFYKIRYGIPVAVFAIGVTIWLLSSSKLNELRDIGIALAAGLLIYGLVEWGKRGKGSHRMHRSTQKIQGES